MMIDEKVFFACPVKYKKIWLAKISENAMRSNVKTYDCNKMVKGLCSIYKFSEPEIKRMALSYYNRKVTLLYRTQNTILFTIFRFYLLKDLIYKKLVAIKSKFYSLA